MNFGSTPSSEGFPQDLLDAIDEQGYATPEQQLALREWCGSDVGKCNTLYQILNSDLGMSHDAIVPAVRQSPVSAQPLNAAIQAVRNGWHQPASVEAVPMRPQDVRAIGDSGNHWGFFR